MIRLNADGTIRFNPRFEDDEQVKRKAGRPKLTGKLQKKIINIIARDGSTTYQKLINETGSKQQCVSSAMLKLESNKLVKRDRVIIDYGIESMNPVRVDVFRLRLPSI